MEFSKKIKRPDEKKKDTIKSGMFYVGMPYKSTLPLTLEHYQEKYEKDLNPIYLRKAFKDFAIASEVGDEAPAWLLEGMDKAFSKYRPFPNEAKFEWLSSAEVMHRWGIDNQTLARNIWNKGLGYYVVSDGWLDRSPNEDLEYQGWIWLVDGEITLGGIVKNLGHLAFSMEDVIQFEKKYPPMQETESPKKDDQNLFRNEGEYWTIAFQGQKSFPVKDRRGLQYIYLLLSCPNKPLSVLEMFQMGRLDPAIIQSTNRDHSADYNQMSGDELGKTENLRKARPGASRDKIISKEKVWQLKKGLAEIEEHLKNVNNPEEILTLKEQKKEMAQLLRTSRTSIIDDSKKPRQAVAKAIKDARKKIGKNSPELEKYLKQTIKIGKDCIYHPLVEKPITWTF